MGAYLLPIGHKGKVSLLSQKFLLPSDKENPLVNPIPPIRSHEIKIEYLANFILCFLCQVMWWLWTKCMFWEIFIMFSFIKKLCCQAEIKKYFTEITSIHPKFSDKMQITQTNMLYIWYEFIVDVCRNFCFSYLGTYLVPWMLSSGYIR